MHTVFLTALCCVCACFRVVCDRGMFGFPVSHFPLHLLPIDRCYRDENPRPRVILARVCFC